jgi:hypothetical protein
VWKYSGTDRQVVCFVLKTYEDLQLKIQYCVGIQRYWETVGLVCTENSWRFTVKVTVLCWDTSVLTDSGFALYWKQLKFYSLIYNIVWGYSGTERQWFWFVLKTAEDLHLKLHYCVGIQLYWETVVLAFTENSWRFKLKLQNCVGIQLYWEIVVLVCTENSWRFKLMLQYCVGIQLYWETVVLVCTENSWRFTVKVTVLCGDTAVLRDSGFGLYWKQLKIYS